MSYQIGTGRVYVGNVKWSSDYTNVMLFGSLSSESAKNTAKNNRNNFMKNNLRQIKSNAIWYDPNTYIDIKGRIKNVSNVNYLYYEPDSDISTTHFCCFVTDYEYLSANTTRLFIQLDTWQTYIYDTNLYQSYIERAIVSSSQNNANNNYLPEPVTNNLEYEKELKTILTESDWQPIWVLHSASYYNNTTHEYEYKGTGTSNTFGEYGRFIETLSEIETILKKYGKMSPFDALGEDENDEYSNWISDLLTGQTIDKAVKLISTTSISDLQDHRNELIGLYAIPKWLKEKYVSESDHSNYADNRRIALDNIPLTINSNQLANGYTPRNKKMLTSVCRGYVLANRTGLKIPFKPELFSDNPSITLHGITMATSGYQYSINGYYDKQLSFGEVAYASERRVGYDANTGINKALSIIGAGADIAQSAGGLIGGVATQNPLAIVSGATNTIGSVANAVEKIGQQEAHFGNNGDLLRITGTRPILRWFEINPSVSECEAIDNFFDMYGYTINRHQNIANYTNNRSNWNFVKTQNADLRVFAPARYENEIKNIFNSGVRIWHNYEHYADYTQTNS